MVQALCRHKLCPGLWLILPSPALSSPRGSALVAQRTGASFSSSCHCGKRPGLLLRGHCHVLVFVSQRCLSGPWAAGAEAGADLKGLCAVGRRLPSLVLHYTGASAPAPRGSSALECPHEGSAEPLLSLSTTAQPSYSSERPVGCLPWLSPLPLRGAHF